MKLRLPKTEQEPNKANMILEMNANIKEILNEIYKIQAENITSENKNSIRKIIEKADLIITECHTMKRFSTNKNQNFNRLIFEYQSLKLKYESYQIKVQISNVNEEYKEIKNNQNEIKDETNNLVYNILGFIASFSIVSASVTAIQEIKKFL